MSFPSEERRVAFRAGTRLGHFEITGRLGSGGMGEVYRARDTRLGRDVALKVLPSEVADDPERLARFSYEARMLSALNHPNILSIYDIGADAHVPYIVFELLQGETLREAMEDHPLSTTSVLNYASQIALGLAAAHEQGIVHRDLKPENIFLTREGRVKILDFGVAKAVVPAGPGGTTAGHSVKRFETDPGVVGCRGISHRLGFVQHIPLGWRQCPRARGRFHGVHRLSGRVASTCSNRRVWHDGDSRGPPE